MMSHLPFFIARHEKLIALALEVDERTPDQQCAIERTTILVKP